MRRCFTIILLSLVITACDPAQYGSAYYVKNSTDQPLKLCLGGSDDSIYPIVGIVAPGDSAHFSGTSVVIRGKNKLYFDWFIQEQVSRWGDEVSLKVSSPENSLLKEWDYLDRNQSGKQFFNESSWRHYDVFDGGKGIITLKDIWVFTILPEDINQFNH